MKFNFFLLLIILFIFSCNNGEVEVEVKESLNLSCNNNFLMSSKNPTLGISLEEKKNQCDAECSVNVVTTETSGKKITHNLSKRVPRNRIVFELKQVSLTDSCTDMKIEDYDCTPTDCVLLLFNQ